jgi:hypothetical protein
MNKRKKIDIVTPREEDKGDFAQIYYLEQYYFGEGIHIFFTKTDILIVIITLSKFSGTTESAEYYNILHIKLFISKNSRLGRIQK